MYPAIIFHRTFKKMTFMKPAIQFIFCSALISMFISGCRKSESEGDLINEELITARPVPPPPPPPVHGICNYTIDETAITGAGWTKVFDEDFEADLSKWNTWYGSAFNNELQLYQASNLSMSNGNLEIQARKETIAGPTHPWDNTQKNIQLYFRTN